MPGNTWLIGRTRLDFLSRNESHRASAVSFQGECQMRTDDFRPSDNVEDDRQLSASRGGGMPGGAGGLGIGTVIIIGLISWYFGIDPSVLLNGAQILTGGGPRAAHIG